MYADRFWKTGSGFYDALSAVIRSLSAIAFLVTRGFVIPERRRIRLGSGFFYRPVVSIGGLEAKGL
jgi:hypothetical protein